MKILLLLWIMTIPIYSHALEYGQEYEEVPPARSQNQNHPLQRQWHGYKERYENRQEEEQSLRKERKIQMSNSSNTARHGLPHAQGRRFFTLEAYLAHLKIMGMQDRPYYRKVAPNRYRLEVGRGGAGRATQYFTRQQLMKKYGFEE